MRWEQSGWEHKDASNESLEMEILLENEAQIVVPTTMPGRK